MRVLLQVDILTNKVYGVKEYFGDGGGVDATVDNMEFLEQAEKDGVDIYYENGKLIGKEQDLEDYYNKTAALKKEIEIIKAEERKAFISYAESRFDDTAAEKLRAIATIRIEKHKIFR